MRLANEAQAEEAIRIATAGTLDLPLALGEENFVGMSGASDWMRRLRLWPHEWKRRQQARAAQAPLTMPQPDIVTPGGCQREQLLRWFRGSKAPHERARRGEVAERFAAAELERRGLCVIERNWRAGHDEIDLIARDAEGQLIFIEVRARQAHALFQGARTLSKRKHRALARVIQAYLRRQGERRFRADLFTVELEGDRVIRGIHQPHLTLRARVWG